MKQYVSIFIIAIITGFFVFNGNNFAGDNTYLMTEDNPVSQHGTVSFLLQTDKTYSNGKGQDNFGQFLLELPGLAGCYIQRSDFSVNIYFLWFSKDRFARCFDIQFEDLPGPATYFFQFTWNSAKGLFEGYMNGNPLRYPGIRFEPWRVDGQATQTKLSSGPNKVTKVEVLSRYMNKEEVVKRVPKELLGKGLKLLGNCDSAVPIDLSKRRGKLLYASKMNNKASVHDWILEGPGEIRFKNDKMIMRSKTPNPSTRGTGHFNFWCPKDFPESFIAEWEYEPLKDHGLSIVFFAAKGVTGKDIFDPSLPKRDGTFKHYTRGVINNYYISYYAHLPLYQTGRTYGNLRKNNKFYIISRGPIATAPGAKGFHRLRLIKDGPHIQLLANDRICVDFTDPGSERYGPVLGDGKIGFRQMAVTEGAYRNFRVYHLR